MTQQVTADVLANDAVLARTLADSALAAGFALLNGYLDWSVSGNVLTVAVKTLAGADPSAADPVRIVFRSETAATGAPVVRELTAATSISINNTALLGTSNSTAFRLWCVAFDDGGTVRLGIINCLSGTSIYPLAGWSIASSTLEADGADSAHVFYTDTAAVTSKAYATLGYATWESGLATAGTWSAAPTRAQLWGAGVPLPGQTIQSQRTQSGAVSVVSVVIPMDDTIPQITEGTELLTQAVTPKSAANLLETKHWGHYSADGTSYIQLALFQDAGANAIAVSTNFQDAASFGVPEGHGLEHTSLAGTTSATTMRLRVGKSAAGDLTINGTAGARRMGGVYSSFLTVKEIMA
jgi:hypothetical protein